MEAVYCQCSSGTGFNQIAFGADCEKPTQILFCGVGGSGLFRPIIAVSLPPVYGRDAVSGEFRTKKLAAYPRELNRVLALSITDAVQNPETRDLTPTLG